MVLAQMNQGILRLSVFGLNIMEISGSVLNIFFLFLGSI